MDYATETFDDREERLGELFSDWLEVLESGQSPDRQEWLARYPEYASELEEFLADEDRMRSLAAPLREAAQAAFVATPLPWETLSPQCLWKNLNPVLLETTSCWKKSGEAAWRLFYRARQKGLERFVALKLFRTDRLGRVTDLERLSA